MHHDAVDGKGQKRDAVESDELRQVAARAAISQDHKERVGDVWHVLLHREARPIACRQAVQASVCR